MTVEARPFPAAAHYRRDKLSSAVAVPERVNALPSTASAKDRLVASRLRIRDELMNITHPPLKPSFFSRTMSLEDKVKNFVLELPGVAWATDFMQNWRADHPAHQAGAIAARVSSALAKPVVRRYPRSALAAAGAVGAIVVLLRPWRWLLRPSLFLSAATQIGTTGLRKPGRASWLALLSAMVKSR